LQADIRRAQQNVMISDRETSIEERIAHAEDLLASFNVTDLGPSLADMNANEVSDRANQEWCRQQPLSGPAGDEAARSSAKPSTGMAAQDQTKSSHTATEQPGVPAPGRDVPAQAQNSGDDISIDMTLVEPADEGSTYVLDSNADTQRQSFVEEGGRPVVNLPRTREEDASVYDSVVPAQQTRQAASAPPQAVADEHAEESVDSKANSAGRSCRQHVGPAPSPSPEDPEL
jgi:hypothetical protein